MGEVLMIVIVELFGPWERKLFLGLKKGRCLKIKHIIFNTFCKSNTFICLTKISQMMKPQNFGQ